MRADNNWQDYRLLDATDGYRLESWGGVILVRPDPPVVWKFDKKSPLWEKAHAVYHRSSSGGGHWEYKKKFPDSWTIDYNNMTFKVSPTGFKHTGIFPEQATNWDEYKKMIEREDREINVLNLFGYTGGATLACAEAGARVCHVDSSKGMVAWGKENARLSNLSDRPIRWIVDDCIKFVQREIRRGNTYDGIIMDPPSYGRGPKGEIWKIEDSIYPFIQLTAKLLSKDSVFFLINSYTTGLQPAVLSYMISTAIIPQFGGRVEAEEIGLPVTESGLILPCGASGRWCK